MCVHASTLSITFLRSMRPRILSRSRFYKICNPAYLPNHVYIKYATTHIGYFYIESLGIRNPSVLFMSPLDAYTLPRKLITGNGRVRFVEFHETVSDVSRYWRGIYYYLLGTGICAWTWTPNTTVKTEKLLSLIVIFIIIKQIIVSVNYIYILSGSFFSASLESNKDRSTIVLNRSCNSEAKRKYINH